MKVVKVQEEDLGDEKKTSETHTVVNEAERGLGNQEEVTDVWDILFSVYNAKKGHFRGDERKSRLVEMVRIWFRKEGCGFARMVVHIESFV